MISTIIFSKNRACQLDLLLRSIEKNFGNISKDIWVLHYSDTPDFRLAYQKVINNFPGVAWWTQLSDSFQKDTMTLLGRAKKYVCFFVDDNIVYRKPEIHGDVIEKMMDEFEDAGCFSLRLGLNTTIQDPYSKTPIAKMPYFVDFRLPQNINVLSWDWTSIPMSNFSYPFSVDGHIYNTQLVQDSLDYEFDTPNAFEGRFVHSRIPSAMFCLPQSSVVNNPINLVGSSQNKAGVWHGHSLEELNQAYLDDRRIQLEVTEKILGCHQEIPISYV